MTDITITLRERLKSIDDELLSLSRRREGLVKLRETVSEALAQEEALANPTQQQLVLHPTGRGSSSSVADLILATLKRTQRPMTLDELKKDLARFFSPDTQSGRSINITLVGLQRGGHVERRNDGAWELVSGESQNQ